MLSRRGVLAGDLGAVALSAVRLGAATKPRPLVFAHRGASALRPEHTLAAYAEAIEDGADYVEPDLVATRDGVLVARHENNIAETTDVADRPIFASRRSTKTIDGMAQTGWFTEDFTLAELKTLRAKERLGPMRPKSRGYDGQFQIVTLDEVIDFVAAEAATRSRTIGLIPELKHSTYFASIGLALEDRFVDTLQAHVYTRGASVEVQSFEVANLVMLRARLGRPSNLRLMQLIGAPGDRPADVARSGGTLTYGIMMSASGLTDVSRYADAVGPSIRAAIPLGPDERLAAPTRLVADAHAAGLLVHPWTFRPENRFLALDFRDAAGSEVRNPEGSIAEMRRYLATGIDGLFTDDPALAWKALAAP